MALHRDLFCSPPKRMAGLVDRLGSILSLDVDVLHPAQHIKIHNVLQSITKTKKYIPPKVAQVSAHSLLSLTHRSLTFDSKNSSLTD